MEGWFQSYAKSNILTGHFETTDHTAFQHAGANNVVYCLLCISLHYIQSNLPNSVNPSLIIKGVFVLSAP